MLSPVKFDFDGMCGGASQYDHLTLHTIMQAKGGEIVYLAMEVETLYLWRVVVVARKRQRLASMNTETGRWRYSPCEEVARKHWLCSVQR